MSQAVNAETGADDECFKDLRPGMLIPKPIGVENRNSISEVVAPIPKLHSVPHRGDDMMTKK